MSLSEPSNTQVAPTAANLATDRTPCKHSSDAGSLPACQRSPWWGVARLCAFFCIFVLSCFCLDQAIKIGIRKIPTSGIGSFNRAMLGEVNAQIVISGSSRALVHYDPRIIAQLTGKTAYNLGRNGSHVDMHLAVLKAYLDKNSKPDLVIYNLDLHSFLPTEELYDPAQYLPFLSDPDLYDAIKKLEPDVWKWKYLPLYGYAVQDMRFTWLLGLKGLVGVYPAEDHFMGYNPRDLRWTGDFDKFKAEKGQGFTVGMKPQGVSEVRGILGLCQEKGIPVLLAYAPEYREAQELSIDREEIFTNFRSLAREFSVAFLDFSDSPISLQRELFYNSQHLNKQGAELFSKELATKLLKSSVFPIQGNNQLRQVD